MGKYFSDPVEQALKYIYYREWEGRGKEGIRLLEEAADSGDGDASCILARCLCGDQYVWIGHGFKEDEKQATQLLHRAVEQGSAMAVLLCLRTGDMTPSVERSMPFSSLKEAFDIVLKKAKGLFQSGAQAGHPLHQKFWADALEDEGKKEEALDWYKRAAENGQTDCWLNVGIAYETGEVVPKDYAYAAACYEKCLDHPYSAGPAHNDLGRLYFLGRGVPQDYARAYELLSWAYADGSAWGVGYPRPPYAQQIPRSRGSGALRAGEAES